MSELVVNLARDPGELLLAHLVEPPRELSELLVRGPERLLGLAPLGDVERGAEHAAWRSVLVEEHPPVGPKPAGVARGRMNDAKLDGVIGPLLEGTADSLGDARGVLGVDGPPEIIHRAAEGLRSEPVELVDALGPRHPVGPDVPVPDAALGGVEGQPEPLLALAQRGFGLPAIGDVASVSTACGPALRYWSALPRASSTRQRSRSCAGT